MNETEGQPLHFQRDELQQWSPESLARYFSEECPVNETETLTLSQFVRDRLAEWEALVHQAQERDWSGETPRFYDVEGSHRDEWGLHTFHVSPEFVLEDIMSKRAIVDLHDGPHDCTELRTGTYPADWPETASWGKAGDDWQHPGNVYFEDGDCPTLRLLAAPYRHHPDFLEAWA